MLVLHIHVHVTEFTDVFVAQSPEVRLCTPLWSAAEPGNTATWCSMY